MKKILQEPMALTIAILAYVAALIFLARFLTTPHLVGG